MHPEIFQAALGLFFKVLFHVWVDKRPYLTGTSECLFAKYSAFVQGCGVKEAEAAHYLNSLQFDTFGGTSKEVRVRSLDQKRKSRSPDLIFSIRSAAMLRTLSQGIRFNSWAMTFSPAALVSAEA